MTPRALIAHLVFAALALGFAWVQANAVEERKGGPTSTVLLDAKKGEVASVSYAWPKGTSKVTSTGAEAARAVVVELDRELDAKKKPDKKDETKDEKKDDKSERGDEAKAGPDAGPADTEPPPLLEPPPEREQARFPGGKSVVGSLEALEPLKTRRTLGEVDGERLQAMGLDKPERTLTVTTASGKTLVLEIGESAYGGQGRYARVQGEKVVHLLEPALVTGLEGAADSLMEKRVVTAAVEDILGFAARSGDTEKAFVHKDRDQAQKRRFVPKDDPTSTSDEPGKAMTTLRNLRAKKLVTEEQLAGSAVAAFKIEVEGTEPVVVEVLERTDGAGHLVRAGGWLFEISETQGKELLEDLDAALQ